MKVWKAVETEFWCKNNGAEKLGMPFPGMVKTQQKQVRLSLAMLIVWLRDGDW